MQPDAQVLVALIAITAILLQIANSAKSLFSKPSKIEQPFQIKHAAEPVEKPEFAALVNRVDKLENKLDSKLETIAERLNIGFKEADEARRQSISGVYKTIEDKFSKAAEEDTRTRERLAAIEQQNRDFSAQLQSILTLLKEMSAKIDIKR
jgi:DNA anti-recombination protein RmuC